jgi:hypothetical protein
MPSRKPIRVKLPIVVVVKKPAPVAPTGPAT